MKTEEVNYHTHNGVKFLTHNDKQVATGGTSLQGYININFQNLKELGTPHESDGYKSDAEWELEFEDGTVATIYNYKNGKNYQGKNGDAVEDITQWNIGGNNANAVHNVRTLFPNFTSKVYGE